MKVPPFRRVLLPSVLPLAFLLAACPHRMKTAETPAAPAETAQTPGAAQAVYEVGKDWMKVPEVASVYFDYMEADLTPEAREGLRKNAERLKKAVEKDPSLKVRVEGNCDQRGTHEYNMALGQRRAEAMRRYYVSMGLPREDVETVSFGKERPACQEEEESCWSRNRRGDTAISSPSGAVKVSFHDEVSSAR